MFTGSSGLTDQRGDEVMTSRTLTSAHRSRGHSLGVGQRHDADAPATFADRQSAFPSVEKVLEHGVAD